MQPLTHTLSEWRKLFVLGGPILIAQLAQMANAFVDTVMAGNASAMDLAAVGIGVSFWVPLYLFFTGLLGALQPIISEHMGAKRYAKVLPMAWQGIYLAFISSALMVALLWFAMPIVELFKPEPQTQVIIDGYIKAFMWGVPALLLLLALRGYSDGLGHTRVFMVCSLLGTACNVPFNYVLIYGKLGFEPMGGIGCGWATTGANVCALVALCGYLHWHKSFKQVRVFQRVFPLCVATMRELLKLGLPIGVTLFVEVSMFCAIALFLAPLGAETVAAHQIVLNATSMAFMIPLSLGMAVMLRVSYLVGENDRVGARLVARSSMVLAIIIACINAPILFFGRAAIADFYSSEAEVIAIATYLFMFAAGFQVVDVIQVVAVNALRGYKDTTIPMWIILLAFWAICLPLGYFLAYTDLLLPQMGASGYWMALFVGLAVAALLLTWRLLVFKPELK